MKVSLASILLIMPIVCSGVSAEWRTVSGYDSDLGWRGIKRGLFEIVPIYGADNPARMLASVDGDGWILITAMVGMAIEPSVADLFNVTFYTDPSMESYHQSWHVAKAGDIVRYDTTHNLAYDQYLIHIDPTSPDGNITGPSKLAVKRDDSVYLAFTSNEQYGDSPDSIYYGWVQFGVEEDGNIVVLDSACDFDHGPMVVGGGAWTGTIPEPSAGVLFLLGLAGLALRHRCNALNCGRCRCLT